VIRFAEAQVRIPGPAGERAIAVLRRGTLDVALSVPEIPKPQTPGILVEPACGATLALVYDGAPALEQLESVLLIVCGGVSVTVGQLQEWSSQYA
jgi:hypothetical protein